MPLFFFLDIYITLIFFFGYLFVERKWKAVWKCPKYRDPPRDPSFFVVIFPDILYGKPQLELRTESPRRMIDSRCSCGPPLLVDVLLEITPKTLGTSNPIHWVQKVPECRSEIQEFVCRWLRQLRPILSGSIGFRVYTCLNPA